MKIIIKLALASILLLSLCVLIAPLFAQNQEVMEYIRGIGESRNETYSISEISPSSLDSSSPGLPSNTICPSILLILTGSCPARSFKIKRDRAEININIFIPFIIQNHFKNYANMNASYNTLFVILR